MAWIGLDPSPSLSSGTFRSMVRVNSIRSEHHAQGATVAKVLSVAGGSSFKSVAISKTAL